MEIQYIAQQYQNNKEMVILKWVWREKAGFSSSYQGHMHITLPPTWGPLVVNKGNLRVCIQTNVLKCANLYLALEYCGVEP